MVIGCISQSCNSVNSSTQGSKQKVTRRRGAYFSTENSRKMRFWNAQTGDERWITFILTFSYFCFQHYQLPLPVICFFSISTIGEGLFAIICKMLPQIIIITKKYGFPCSVVNVHVTIRFVYFISCQTYG